MSVVPREPPSGHDDDPQFHVEFDGPGANPREIRTITFLGFFGNYLDLLSAASVEACDEALTFSGLKVREKCFWAGAYPSNIAIAQECAALAEPWLERRSSPPRGLHELVSKTRDLLGEFPPDQVGRVIIDSVVIPFRPVPLKDTAPELSPWVRITVRATLLRLGGKTPAARFTGIGGRPSFTLTLTQEDARRLGFLLYKDLDVTCLVSRGLDGRIEEGAFISAVEVPEHSPEEQAVAWRRWYQGATGLPRRDQT